MSMWAQGKDVVERAVKEVVYGTPVLDRMAIISVLPFDEILTNFRYLDLRTVAMAAALGCALAALAALALIVAYTYARRIGASLPLPSQLSLIEKVIL